MILFLFTNKYEYYPGMLHFSEKYSINALKFKGTKIVIISIGNTYLLKKIMQCWFVVTGLYFFNYKGS
jgi:hypothetical protein